MWIRKWGAAQGGRPVMPNQRYKPEQIVNLLRKIEVEIANGKTTPQAAREAGITEQTVGSLVNNSELWTNPCTNWNAGGSMTWDLGGNTRGNCMVQAVYPGSTSTLNLANVAPAGHYSILFFGGGSPGTATLNLGSGCGTWFGNTSVNQLSSAGSQPPPTIIPFRATREAIASPAGTATAFQIVTSEALTTSATVAINRMNIDVLIPGWVCLVTFQ
jgi:hypothetical protein